MMARVSDTTGHWGLFSLLFSFNSISVYICLWFISSTSDRICDCEHRVLRCSGYYYFWLLCVCMLVMESVRLCLALTAVSLALWGHRNEALLFWGRWNFELCIFYFSLMCCLFLGPSPKSPFDVLDVLSFRHDELMEWTAFAFTVERCNSPGMHVCVCARVFIADIIF